MRGGEAQDRGLVGGCLGREVEGALVLGLVVVLGGWDRHVGGGGTERGTGGGGMEGGEGEEG